MEWKYGSRQWFESHYMITYVSRRHGIQLLVALSIHDTPRLPPRLTPIQRPLATNRSIDHSIAMRLSISVAAVLVALAVLRPPRVAVAQKYAAIFNFGDSLVDAGNLVVDGIPDYLATARLPYGMTYFGYPTGRCSDGRLVVDFIAQEVGLPLLPPSKAKNATFHRGANFAITGATSLDTPYFQGRGLGHTVWNSGSLHTQIKWFQDMKASICKSPQECRDLFRRSLFIVGEFGGNDYNSPLFAFRPLEEVHTFVPDVKLIEEGAVELVVPGVLPIGCFPVYLSIFRKQPEMYGRRSGCIRDLNTLSWVHNAALQRKIAELRLKHPGVRIMYADYYTPAIQFVLHAEKYGFLRQTPRACCGAPGVGEYNFNLTSKCGDPGSYACDDPSNHWSWDGIHLTEASYGHIAKGWLYAPYSTTRSTMKLLRIVLVLLLPAFSSCLPCRRRRYGDYDSIYSFGDSFADTGNGAVVFAEHSLFSPATKPPYGMTFFGHPHHRLHRFRQGANFAVSGATTLDASFFSDIPGVGKFVLNTSSSVQLGWFDSLKPSLCSPAQECKGFFHKSLFFMGEFGVNDYSFSVFGKTPLEDGAKAVVVPGIPPLGCMPPNLAMFPSTDPAGYEPGTGCLRQFNEIAVYHNTLLQDAIKNVQKNHPDVRVIYAEFFTPVIRIVQSPGTFSFTSDILRCCCGGGGKYNFNMSAGCGMPGATVCEDPSRHLFWDGLMTEAAYHFIADGWLNSINES
uniref:Esterase n=1 Tax=Oryza meridionalis TaxID=40149 RepID=A0A0E0BZ10_9ORYZ